jgi:hypothetical protein
MTKELLGPLSYENWNAALSGQDKLRGFEFPFFTDGPHIVGEITEGFGPYQIINTVAVRYSPDEVRPALVLRVSNYLEFESQEMNKTRDKNYHGGYEADEIAALISLCLGIRLKAGAASRMFGIDDPMGRPTARMFSEDPIFVQRQFSQRRKILKSTLTQHTLPDEVDILTTFPSLSVENAIALVRAARMYQEAVWIVEITPELSWIMLVSAVETVANQWHTEIRTPIEKMRSWRSKLERILRKYGADKSDELVQQVAEEIAPYIGATGTFTDFLLEFLPSAPAIRPPLFAQHSWDKKVLRKTLKQIYNYRSRALHAGRPFPAPMCEPATSVGENGELAEIPIGLAVGMKGSVWISKDIPMLLHTFEYIARNAILNWWKSVAPLTNDNL